MNNTTTQYPTTATLIEQARPNAKGEGVIQIHARGCQHQNRVRDDLITDVPDADSTWLDYGTGVQGAVDYLIALRSGMLDDGVASFPWVARLAPCAR